MTTRAPGPDTVPAVAVFWQPCPRDSRDSTWTAVLAEAVPVILAQSLSQGTYRVVRLRYAGPPAEPGGPALWAEISPEPGFTRLDWQTAAATFARLVNQEAAPPDIDGPPDNPWPRTPGQPPAAVPADFADEGELDPGPGFIPAKVRGEQVVAALWEPGQPAYPFREWWTVMLRQSPRPAGGWVAGTYRVARVRSSSPPAEPGEQQSWATTGPQPGTGGPDWLHAARAFARLAAEPFG